MTAPTVYTTGAECPCGPPCSASCADDQAIAETDRAGADCDQPIGWSARYVYGPSGRDLYHASCWVDGCQDRPAPVQTYADSAGERDEVLL